MSSPANIGIMMTSASRYRACIAKPVGRRMIVEITTFAPTTAMTHANSTKRPRLSAARRASPQRAAAITLQSTYMRGGIRVSSQPNTPMVCSSMNFPLRSEFGVARKADEMSYLVCGIAKVAHPRLRSDAKTSVPTAAAPAV